jgi:hypothetical protein
MKAIVTWWSHEDEVAINDVVELDRVIDDVIKSECREYPTVLEMPRSGLGQECARQRHLQFLFSGLASH